MSPDRESGRREPDTKPSAELPPAPSKCAWDTLSTLLKSALTLCLILSISLVIFTHPTPNSIRWWISSSTAPTPTPEIEHSTGPTTLSHIVFGLAGSTSTWENRRQYSELWWNPNSTRGFVWLDESPPHNYTWPPTSPPYKVSPRDSRSSDRIARILKGSFEAGGAEVRWFVMGDDDTVFFQENLVRVLERYDHREMWYIGQVSESVEQNLMHSYRTAFGGGGFAISYPLAARLANLIDGCLERYSRFYGSDEKVSACVGDLGVPLTRESGFHQLDIREDPYGVLAAHPVAPLVSLHHLDYIRPLFPQQSQLESLKTLIQAYKLDPGRTMQQTICYSRRHKWSFSVSWGYTIQLYPSLLPSRDLELPLRTFRTWRSWSDGPFVFNTRELNPCDQPVIFFLDRVVQKPGGTTNFTLSTFKRTQDVVAPDNAKLCRQSSAYKYAASVERITVSAPKMDTQHWIKAPRRQCCEVKTGWSIKRGVQIAIRSCNLGETITA